MAKLRVTIMDEVRDCHLKVDLPDDAAMDKLLPALAKKLGLPPAAYRLTHQATGRVLGGDQTLASFGVREGDALRLAAAREEAPVVPWPAEEEAVPLWQKVPVWGWAGIVVVVLLAVAALAFLAGRGVRPVPTATVVAEVASLAATSAAVPQPTATPVAPTFTPLPPTATRVPTSTPRPTATPVPPTATPTRTPRPTPTPTATIDADPTVYDNFNNPANDDSFNQSQWTYWSDPPNQVVQQDGILIVTQDSEKPGEGTRLVARKYYEITLNAPTFFEAKLMMSPDKYAGNVQLLDFGQTV